MPCFGHLSPSNHHSPPQCLNSVCPAAAQNPSPWPCASGRRGRPSIQSLTFVLLHSPTVPFPRWGWCCKHSATPELSQQSPRAALTLRTHVWVYTGTPEGYPEAPRLGLEGRSTLGTCCHGLARGLLGCKLSVRHIAPSWEPASAFSWCCLELLCMHTLAQSHSPWSSTREQGVVQPHIP